MSDSEQNGAPILVIYHGNCDDGFGAALAINTADVNMLGAPVTFVAGEYHKPIDPAETAGHHVIFVDFSYKRAEIEAICAVAKSVIVIDHHKSAMDELMSLEIENLTLKFDMSKSGAVMAWEHFHPNDPLPLLYAYLQERDLGRNGMPRTREFSYGLRSYPMDFATWTRFLDNSAVDDLIVAGKDIIRSIDQMIAQLYQHRFTVQIAGHLTIAVNCPYRIASDMGRYILAQNPDLAFAATFCYVDREHVRWSVYSRGQFDVQQLAVQFGCGGHVAAAGFVLPFPLPSGISM